MASAQMGGDTPLSEQVQHTLLILTAADRDAAIEQTAPARSELVLAEAGFSSKQIAAVLGRNPEAVRSVIRRQQAKAKPRKGR